MAFVCLTVAYNPLAIRSRSQRVWSVWSVWTTRPLFLSPNHPLLDAVLRQLSKIQRS
jgi:hypothetical protein